MVEANSDDEQLDGVGTGDVNVSYGLYPSARGRGYVGRALRLVEEFLRDRGFQATVIRVALGNDASLAVPRRAGYSEIGSLRTRDGDDLIVFRKELQSHPD